MKNVGTNGFPVRVVVLSEVDTDALNVIEVDLYGDRAKGCALREGDVVTVDFRLRGREWNGKIFVRVVANQMVIDSRTFDGMKM